jgi:hypothetical protein
MDFVFDLLQGAGIAAAIGIRPFLPVLLVGALAAGASVLFPPLAVLVVGGLLALLVGGRRRAGEKYAGLRILR